MLEGWIKLHRSLLEHMIFTNPKLLKVWIWCLQKARHKPGEVYMGRKKLFLERGQFIFGRKTAAEKLNMAQSTIWDLMKVLKANRSINISSTSRFSIITVKNWSFYQWTSTDVPTTNGQQMDTNNNVKNDKNVCIAKNRRYQHKQQLGDERPKYRSRDNFDPRVGSRSSQPTEEEEKTTVPQLKAEYREKRAEYMRKEGIENEEDIDWTKKPTETDYISAGLIEIRKKRSTNHT